MKRVVKGEFTLEAKAYGSWDVRTPCFGASVLSITLNGVGIPDELLTELFGENSRDIRNLIRLMMHLKIAPHPMNKICMKYAKGDYENCWKTVKSYEKEAPNGHMRIYQGWADYGCEQHNPEQCMITNGHLACAVEVGGRSSWNDRDKIAKALEGYTFPENAYVERKAHKMTIPLSVEHFKQLTSLSSDEFEVKSRLLTRLADAAPHLSYARKAELACGLMISNDEEPLACAEKDSRRRSTRDELFEQLSNKPLRLHTGWLVNMGTTLYYVDAQGNVSSSPQSEMTRMKEIAVKLLNTQKPPTDFKAETNEHITKTIIKTVKRTEFHV